MITFGNTEEVYWTKNKLKKVFLLKDDTIRVIFSSHIDTFKCVRYKTDPFYYTRKYSTDSTLLYYKVDSNTLINNVLCDTYKDSLGKITAYLIKDKPIQLGYNSNYRDLIKLEIEMDGYTIVKELIKQKHNIDTLNVFNIDKDKIVKSFHHCSNLDSIKLQLEQFSSSFNKKNKFPSYLISNELEGEIKLTFLINNKGEPVSPKISPVFFRYANSYEKISDKKKILRITRIIEKSIIKYYTESMTSIKFDIPMSNQEPINILIIMPLEYYYIDND